MTRNRKLRSIGSDNIVAVTGITIETLARYPNGEASPEVVVRALEDAGYDARPDLQILVKHLMSFGLLTKESTNDVLQLTQKSIRGAEQVTGSDAVAGHFRD